MTLRRATKKTYTPSYICKVTIQSQSLRSQNASASITLELRSSQPSALARRRKKKRRRQLRISQSSILGARDHLLPIKTTPRLCTSFPRIPTPFEKL